MVVYTFKKIVHDNGQTEVKLLSNGQKMLSASAKNIDKLKSYYKENYNFLFKDFSKTWNEMEKEYVETI